MAKIKDMEWDKNGTRAFRFWCPGCDSSHAPIEGRWEFNGDYEKPTFSPSILVTWTWGPERIEKRCHSFVRDGQIQFLSDCTHELAGQTVDLPDLKTIDEDW